MIDFRYHIVSIVAIFLALAVGIVLGSGPLKDNIGGLLETQTAQLAQQKVDLQSQVGALRSDVNSNQKYAELVQPNVVRGLLVAQPVVLVQLPGASGDTVDAVTTAVDQAGGNVTERIEIQASWTDPTQKDVLGRLSDSIVHRGGATDAYDLAGQALAGALVTNNVRLVGQPFAPSTGILAAFEDAGFIKAGQGSVVRAGSAIVIGSDSVDSAASASLLPLLSAIDANAQGEVVSGPLGSAESGGIVGTVRDSDLGDRVSTDDRAETAQGVTVAVLALVDNRNGQVGDYGTGPGAQGPAPDPVPGS